MGRKGAVLFSVLRLDNIRDRRDIKAVVGSVVGRRIFLIGNSALNVGCLFWFPFSTLRRRSTLIRVRFCSYLFCLLMKV